MITIQEDIYSPKYIQPGQINPWQEVGVARNPWVDFVVGKDHCVHLDVVFIRQISNQSIKQSHLDVLNLVRVVADHTRKLHPPDFIQLEEKVYESIVFNVVQES